MMVIASLITFPAKAVPLRTLAKAEDRLVCSQMRQANLDHLFYCRHKSNPLLGEGQHSETCLEMHPRHWALQDGETGTPPSQRP